MSYFVHETAEVDNIQLSDGVGIYKNASVRQCTIGEFSKFGDFGRMERSVLGKHVDIQRYAMIYDSNIGDYSYCGRNFTAWHCRIGKYCSLSWNVSIGGANHDYERISQHAFLYAGQFDLMPEHRLGYDRFESECHVGNDVWIGCNAVITRGVHIGDGAVVGAGAVVTHDIAPYTIVGGVPAHFIKRRCPRELAERLIASAWWDLPPETIRSHFDLFNAKISEESVSAIEKIVCK